MSHTNHPIEEIAAMIDHSLLQPQMTDDEMEKGFKTALQYRVASVCIKPYYLQKCSAALAGSNVKPSTVIGFPHGGHATSVKVNESVQALKDGGVELDLVVNIGKVLSGDWNFVRSDVQAVLEPVHAGGGVLKVIFETCYLNEIQKVRLCDICAELGVDYAKTSTGFGSAGATVDDIKLMKKHLPSKVRIKAAGGIRDYDTLLAMKAAGASRVGATRTVELLEECRRRYNAEMGTLL